MELIIYIIIKRLIMKKYIRFLLFKNRLRNFGISPLDIFLPIVSWIGVIGIVFFTWYLVNVL